MMALGQLVVLLACAWGAVSADYADYSDVSVDTLCSPTDDNGDRVPYPFPAAGSRRKPLF